VNRQEAAREITSCVAQLFFSAENQSRFHGAAEELGIAPPVLKALLELDPGERVPMRDLADRWSCDASFVTVVCDGLEAQGFASRRVAEHDRRIKVVELTDAGIAALERASDLVYGPRVGFDALAAKEQVTLARLLRRVADAQAEHDEQLLHHPDVEGMVRRMSAQLTRAAARDRGRGPGVEHGGGRGRGGGTGTAVPDDGAGWRPHLDAYRDELGALKEELARVRDEIKALARAPVDEAKAELKAAKATAKADAKAAAADVKADAKAAAADVAQQLKHRRGRR
jgi:DNA-binding MarR family transcriptional regulator